MELKEIQYITLANAHACKVIRNTHKEWSKNTALQKEAENKDRILLLVKELLFGIDFTTQSLHFS